MSALVKSVLEQNASAATKYPSTDVTKAVPPDLDLGHLMCTDQEPINHSLFSSSPSSKKEEYLRALARDNTQLLINKLWELPVERKEDMVIAKLPKPVAILPREKPIPKPKPLTRWEQFAKMKGIQNKKKSRMVWDETHKDWRPLWGYKSVRDTSGDWVLEVPENSDPYEDQFQKRRDEKKEKVAKNELQRLRNIARAQKQKVPGVGIMPVEKPSPGLLSKTLAVAKSSTPSLGKFSETVAKEPDVRVGKKRKFQPTVGDMKTEKERQLEIFEKTVMKKQGKLDTNAANKQIAMDDQRQSKKDQKHKGGKGKGKGKKNSGGKNFSKKFKPNKMKVKKLGRKK